MSQTSARVAAGTGSAPNASRPTPAPIRILDSDDEESGADSDIEFVSAPAAKPAVVVTAPAPSSKRQAPPSTSDPAEPSAKRQRLAPEETEAVQRANPSPSLSAHNTPSLVDSPPKSPTRPEYEAATLLGKRPPSKPMSSASSFASAIEPSVATKTPVVVELGDTSDEDEVDELDDSEPNHSHVSAITATVQPVDITDSEDEEAQSYVDDSQLEIEAESDAQLAPVEAEEGANGAVEEAVESDGDPPPLRSLELDGKGWWNRRHVEMECERVMLRRRLTMLASTGHAAAPVNLDSDADDSDDDIVPILSFASRLLKYSIRARVDPTEQPEAGLLVWAKTLTGCYFPAEGANYSTTLARPI